jgi:hypothetical protein
MTANTTDSAIGHPAGEAACLSAQPPKRGATVAGYRYKLLVTLLLGTTFSLPAEAKLYKWVDNDGITHYGEVIPPEYADKDRVELNQNGRVVKEQEILTPQKRLAKEQADAKKRAEEQLNIDRQRRDKTLINTYSNVNEIELARTRSLQQIDARIYVIQSSIASASANLAGLQNEADGYTKRHREIPQSLKDDLQNAQTRLDMLNNDLAQPLTDKATIEARYDADKARYMELTGKK